MNAVGFADPEDRHDVRVMQTRRGVRFAAEPLQSVFADEAVRRQHFEGDVAAERLLHGLENHAHAAAGNFGHDAIFAEDPSDEAAQAGAISH